MYLLFHVGPLEPAPHIVVDTQKDCDDTAVDAERGALALEYRKFLRQDGYWVILDRPWLTARSMSD